MPTDSHKVPIAIIASIASVLALGPLARFAQDSYRPVENGRFDKVRSSIDDPRLGELAPTELRDGQEAKVVVILPECNSCSLYQVDTTSRFSSTTRVIFVTEEPLDTRIASLAKAHHAELVKLTSSLTNSLNPTFRPRLYLFDRDGRLCYIQRIPKSWNEMVSDSARK